MWPSGSELSSKSITARAIASGERGGTMRAPGSSTAHRRDRAGVGAHQPMDHGGGLGVGQAEAFLVRRLDVNVGRRQGFDLVVVRQVGRDRHMLGNAELPSQALEPGHIGGVADLADELVGQFGKSSHQERQGLDDVVLALGMGDAADGDEPRGIARRRRRAARVVRCTARRVERERHDRHPLLGQAEARDHVVNEAAVNDDARNPAPAKQPTPAQAVGKEAERSREVVQALSVVPQAQLLLRRRKRMHGQRPSRRAQHRKEGDQTLGPGAKHMDEVRFEHVDGLAQLLGRDARERQLEGKVARDLRARQRNVAPQGDLVAEPVQADDEVARLGRHAAAHETGRGTDDQYLHRPDSTFTCAAPGRRACAYSSTIRSALVVQLYSA
jgi:hypothetical protein